MMEMKVMKDISGNSYISSSPAAGNGQGEEEEFHLFSFLPENNSYSDVWNMFRLDKTLPISLVIIR
jgi:hypothetical protein